MVDYTATGLPILLWGPEDSSTIKWAKQNTGVARVVTSPKTEDLRDALHELIDDPGARYEYGKTALEIGKQSFSAENAWKTFTEAVRNERDTRR